MGVKNTSPLMNVTFEIQLRRIFPAFSLDKAYKYGFILRLYGNIPASTHILRNRHPPF